MRDDLHVGLPLPPPWKGVLKAMTDSDWRDKAASKAHDALARELLSNIKPATIQAVQNAVINGLTSDLFGTQSGGDPSPLWAVRRDRSLNPLESRFVDHIESRLTGQNALGCEEIVAQSLDSLTREQLDGIGNAIIQHVALKSVRDATEARSRLGQLTRQIDTTAMSRDLAKGELRVQKSERRKPIDLNEDLRPEANRD